MSPEFTTLIDEFYGTLRLVEVHSSSREVI